MENKELELLNKRKEELLEDIKRKKNIIKKLQ